MLYRYSLLNLSSVMVENDFRQNASASSTERPIPYCCLLVMSALELSLLIDEDGETTRLEEETVLLSLLEPALFLRVEFGLQL